MNFLHICIKGIRKIQDNIESNANKINYEYPHIPVSANSLIYAELVGYGELINREIKCICTLARRWGKMLKEAI